MRNDPRTSNMNQPPHEPTLQHWRAMYDDRAATARDPEGQRAALLVLAETLHARGVIEADDLAELREQADAAYAWGVEAQLTDELNGSDARTLSE
jgi:hypothetical protein